MLDFLKGIAIFLMLWSHCIMYAYPPRIDFFQSELLQCICSVNMPLFMLITGYLFFFSAQKYDVNQLLKNKISGMIHPIIVGGVFISVTSFGVTNIIAQKSVSSILNGSLITRNIGALWYLWSVLAASIVMAAVLSCRRHKILQCVILVAGFFFMFLFPQQDIHAFVYPYFLLGYGYAKWKDVLKKIKFLSYISLVAYPIMLLFYEKKHYIYVSGMFGKGYGGWQNGIAIDLFRFGIGLAGCLFIITCSRFLLKLNFLSWLVKIFTAIGKKSLQLYVMSFSFLSFYLPLILKRAMTFHFFNRFYTRYFYRNSWLYGFGFALLLAIAYSIFLYYLTKLLEKWGVAKYIFGR